MPITLGILAQSRQVVAAGSYDLLETVSLSSNAASIEFTNLNATYGSTYKHLQLRIVTLSTVDTWFRVQINNATTNYYSHRLLAESGSVSSAASASTTTGMNLVGLTGTSSIPGRSVLDILDPFVTTKNTTIRNFTGGPNTVGLVSGLWNDTAAVTSIKLNNDGGNFAQFSRVSLYGIKG
jgi:hypothetical protein